MRRRRGEIAAGAADDDDDDDDDDDAFERSMLVMSARGKPVGGRRGGGARERRRKRMGSRRARRGPAARRRARSAAPVVDHASVSYDAFTRVTYAVPRELAEMSVEEVVAARRARWTCAWRGATRAAAVRRDSDKRRWDVDALSCGNDWDLRATRGRAGAVFTRHHERTRRVGVRENRKREDVGVFITAARPNVSSTQRRSATAARARPRADA